MSTLREWSPFLNRRDLLKVGALGVAGSVLPFATAAPNEARAKSVIVLWMAGGVTHHESFDPKPEAPVEIRGALSSINTAIPGVKFSEVMPNLARELKRFALIRGFVPYDNDHFMSQAYALSGRRVGPLQITTEPNVGSIVSKLLGSRNGLPGYITVPGTTRPGPPPKNLFVGGWLGQEHDPFSTGGRPKNEDFTAEVSEAPEEQFQQQALNFPEGITLDRMSNRQSLRNAFDHGCRVIEQNGMAQAMGRHYHAGFEMLMSANVRQAFDLSREPDKVRDHYGRTKIGQRCLMARRLVEAGARFVLVDYGYDPEYGNLWDNHNAAVQKHPPIGEIAKKPWHLVGTDRAFASLLTDLDDRGKLDDTLVVFLTEFGRTPRINAQGGRDHWGWAGSIFFAGAGVKGGQVIGATDRQGAQVVGQTCTPGDVAATIYHALGIPLKTVLTDRQGREIAMLPDGKPIPGLW